MLHHDFLLKKQAMIKKKNKKNNCIRWNKKFINFFNKKKSETLIKFCHNL